MSIWDNGGTPNKITVSQAITYAKQAGFSGSGLVNAVAIAMAESGLDANSANSTTSGIGTDRGIVKFNSVFHSEVTDACAYDPACAFRQFYRVSEGGTNFNQWCTYNAGCANPPNSNGPYKQFLPQVQAALAGNTTASSTPAPATSLLGLPDFTNIGEHIAVFILAAAFILAGIYLMAQRQVAEAAHRTMDAALKLTI